MFAMFSMFSFSGFAYEMLATKLEYLQNKLIAISYAKEQDRESLDQKLSGITVVIN